jgi:hypothetical protein
VVISQPQGVVFANLTLGAPGTGLSVLFSYWCASAADCAGAWTVLSAVSLATGQAMTIRLNGWAAPSVCVSWPGSALADGSSAVFTHPQGAALLPGWHAVLAAFPTTSKLRVWVDGAEWGSYMGTSDLLLSAFPAEGLAADSLTLGQTPGSVVLGDLQTYDAAAPGALNSASNTNSSAVLVAGSAPAAPRPAWQAPPSAQQRLTACMQAQPAHRYGSGRYPLTYGAAPDFANTSTPVAASMLYARSGPSAALPSQLPPGGLLDFTASLPPPILSLSNIDFSGYSAGLSVFLMSSAPSCGSAKLLDVAGYTLGLISPPGASPAASGTDCASPLAAVLTAPDGTSATLLAAGGPALQPNTPALARAYFGLSIGRSGSTIFAAGRVWASSAAVTWSPPPPLAKAAQRSEIGGWGVLLDVQVYSSAFTPAMAEDLGLGEGALC